jgi:ribosome-interacting GTPase 1
VAAAGIEKPAVVAATRADEADQIAIQRLRAAVPGLPIVVVSVLDDASLEAFRSAVWALTGLIRVHLRKGADIDPEPLALDPGATVADVADVVHHDLREAFVGARVWGPSARFDGQRVGRDHAVLDGDVVEIVR